MKKWEFILYILYGQRKYSLLRNYPWYFLDISVFSSLSLQPRVVSLHCFDSLNLLSLLASPSPFSGQTIPSLPPFSGLNKLNVTWKRKVFFLYSRSFWSETRLETGKRFTSPFFTIISLNLGQELEISGHKINPVVFYSCYYRPGWPRSQFPRSRS